MRAAIIDDLAVCREEIGACLKQYLKERCAQEPELRCFANGKEFLDSFAPEAYDVIFIDQYMPGLSGLDTAGRIRERDARVAIVFVTYSKEHAIDGYGVRACGYLVKPYRYEDFRRTLDAAGLERIRAGCFIRVEEKKILLREILYCDREAHYVQVHTQNRGVLRFRLPFAQIAALLSPHAQFHSCYKSCIVNLDQAERIEADAFVLTNGERLPFSRRERGKIEAQFHEYLFAREREALL